MPAMASNPNKTSITSTRLRVINGSSNDVKKPIADKQVTDTETFEYFILP